MNFRRIQAVHGSNSDILLQKLLEERLCGIMGSDLGPKAVLPSSLFAHLGFFLPKTSFPYCSMKLLHIQVKQGECIIVSNSAE